MREGEKKDKIVISNCHMHYMTVFKYCAIGPQGSLAKFGGQEFLLSSEYAPRERRPRDPFLSGGEDVMRLCHLTAVVQEWLGHEQLDATGWRKTGKVQGEAAEMAECDASGGLSPTGGP